MPAMTGADLPMYDFLGQAAGLIPNLAGIKFTHENPMDYRRCLDFESGRFTILFGRDEILLAALALGATAEVCFAPGVFAVSPQWLTISVRNIQPELDFTVNRYDDSVFTGIL
jgi:dihydrodipicolinate synthase/N-acetylneuraminate lyase